MNVGEIRSTDGSANPAPSLALKRGDLVKLLLALQRIHAAVSTDALGKIIAESVGSLIRSDVISFTQWSERDGHRTFFTTRWLWTDKQRAAAESLLNTHPLVIHFRDNPVEQPVTLSDVISDRAWRSHPFYQQVWKPHGIFRSLQMPVRLDPSSMASVSLDRRSRDYSRRDREVLSLMRPHVVAAWQHLTVARSTSPVAARGSATFGAAGIIRRLRAMGMTPREAEIMHWVLNGKQNREIAMLLGISLRTVQKHVENLLARFGAENRHALTVRAIGDLSTRLESQ